MKSFEKEKIVYQQIMAKGANFGFDNQKFFTDTTASIITGANLKYIVALLNSNLIYFVMRNFYMGGGIEGEIKVNNLEKIPIPKINAKNKKIADKIVNLVDKILESKAQDKDSTTPPCHTTSHFCHTERSEVSQKQKRDFSHSTNAQNDKTIKNCNDTNNHNKDISHTLNIDTTDLEYQIDKLVYQLYCLNQDETKTIKSK